VPYTLSSFKAAKLAAAKLERFRSTRLDGRRLEKSYSPQPLPRIRSLPIGNTRTLRDDTTADLQLLGVLRDPVGLDLVDAGVTKSSSLRSPPMRPARG
jgi:hypothetical protein